MKSQSALTKNLQRDNLREHKQKHHRVIMKLTKQCFFFFFTLCHVHICWNKTNVQFLCLLHCAECEECIIILPVFIVMRSISAGLRFMFCSIKTI